MLLLMLFVLFSRCISVKLFDRCLLLMKCVLFFVMIVVFVLIVLELWKLIWLFLLMCSVVFVFVLCIVDG